jgi:hypothetical protein
LFSQPSDLEAQAQAQAQAVLAEKAICTKGQIGRACLADKVVAGVNYSVRRIDSSDLLPELTCCLT